MASETTTIVSVYAERGLANQAIEALRGEGFGKAEITLLKETGEELNKTLSGFGFEEADVREFADAASSGKTLVAAEIEIKQAERAVGILERFESKGGSESSETTEQTVPIVEEELSVGKSKVGRGGVRVSTQVREQPVEKTVTLREESVDAERRSADRVLKEGEADAAFEEKTVEMMGFAEEAEVRKEARVTGEVALKRETNEREETVKDTVRSTDVQVEEVRASGSKRK